MLGSYGPCTPALHEALKYVQMRLEKKWLARFISTTPFIDRNGENIIVWKREVGASVLHPASLLQ